MNLYRQIWLKNACTASCYFAFWDFFWPFHDQFQIGLYFSYRCVTALWTRSFHVLWYFSNKDSTKLACLSLVCHPSCSIYLKLHMFLVKRIIRIVFSMFYVNAVHCTCAIIWSRPSSSTGWGGSFKGWFPLAEELDALYHHHQKYSLVFLQLHCRLVQGWLVHEYHHEMRIIILEREKINHDIIIIINYLILCEK